MKTARRSSVASRPRRASPAKRKARPAPARSNGAPRGADRSAAPDGATAGRRFPVAGVGASAGGLEAFTQVLQALPAITGIGYVFIQHLDPTHQSMLPEILAKSTRMPVRSVRDGVTVQPDHLYVIPPNNHVTIERGVLRLVRFDGRRGPHLPIDHFFRSLADDSGPLAIAIVLSGTASDGTLGMRAIKAAGGLTFAQDEPSAKYPGMPHSAAAAGVVDAVLTPVAIAREMARLGQHPHLFRPAPAVAGGIAAAPEAPDLGRMFAQLRTAFGVDFSLYKQSTIERRIARRMLLGRIETVPDYVQRLRDSRSELDLLYHDLLINVTSFFREPEVFEVLKRRVFPRLIRDRPADSPIRMWVPGCSTGEEAYSLAMTLLEHAKYPARRLSIQIFATDVSDATIEKARLGHYPESIALDVSSDRLRRFFTKANGGYQIGRTVRDLCVFARQDILRDPPLSRMDLVSCRNLLIYFGPAAQRKILPTLHYALVPGGYLILGSAESVGGSADLFSLEDKKRRIYRRKDATGRMTQDLMIGPSDEQRRVSAPAHAAPVPSAVDAESAADRIILAEYGPPGVVVNDALDILQFRGNTGAFLEPATGAASFNLMKMARREIAMTARAAVQEARRKNRTVRRRTRLPIDGRRRDVTTAVLPLPGPTAEGPRRFLVIFETTPARQESRAAPVAEAGGPRRRGPGSEGTNRIRALEHELAATREYLQTVAADRESTNEELRSALEEVQSSNEELQSTNEEMETAKEELQSTNEELTTVNEELQNRNAELGQVNSDLVNLLSSINMPILMLGNDLRIRRITPTAERVLKLIPADIGRSIGDLRLALEVPRLEPLIAEVLESLETREIEVQDKDGRWFALRLRPYRTIDNKIDGVVMLMVDIDYLKRGIDEVRQARDCARAIVETVREPLVVLDGELRIQTANRTFYQTFGVGQEATEGRSLFALEEGRWDIPDLRTALTQVLPKDQQFGDVELETTLPGIGRRRLRLHARRLENGRTAPSLILLTLEDRGPGAEAG